jgi:uncharacterized protein (DUF433 family)
MAATIVNNRIDGLRITVWDVYHYIEGGWTVPQIADILRLTTEQVEVALKYIEEHKEYVLKVHREIEERNARGNSPELQAKLDASHARFLEMVKQRQQQRLQERNGAGDPLR